MSFQAPTCVHAGLMATNVRLGGNRGRVIQLGGASGGTRVYVELLHAVLVVLVVQVVLLVADVVEVVQVGVVRDADAGVPEIVVVVHLRVIARNRQVVRGVRVRIT